MPVATLLDDAALFAAWRERGERAAYDELTARYLPRAHQVARRFRNRSEPLDDLEQVAGIGLVKALARYRPGEGAQFWTYALPTVIGELKRHLRDHCWTVHVPRSLQDRMIEVSRAVGRLGGRLGRSPSIAELARELDLDPEEVLEALEVSSAFAPDSLDEPTGTSEDGATVGELVGADDGGLEAVERRAALWPAMEALPPRQRLILQLRFEEDLTQSQIAARVGLSQMHVSRLIRDALTRLRRSTVPACL